MSADLTPQLAGANWVVPAIVSTNNSQIQIQVSVAVSDTETLKGSDLTVQATAGANDLAQLTGPDPDAELPSVETRAITAFAIYSFDNPQNSTLTSVTIKLTGQAVTFDVTGLVA